MSTLGGPNIITDGLVLAIDAANQKSYPGSGTSILDLSGNSNDGILTNGPTFDSGNTGNIVFDGQNDYINIPDSPIINLTTEGGVFLWLNPTSYVNYTGIISKAPNTTSIGTQAHYHFEVYSNRARTVISNVDLRSGTESTGQSPLIDLNQWHQYGFQWDSSTMYQIKDGVIVATKSHSSSATTTSDNLFIARRNGFGYLSGKMSNITIYSRALSSTEILQNYNATKTRFI